jgi:hypothetical protein
MPDAVFLAEHPAAHPEARSATVDLVASVLEREMWKRWPDGREDAWRTVHAPITGSTAWGMGVQTERIPYQIKAFDRMAVHHRDVR